MMSREYAENRIREALRLAHGNTTKARQQIMAWAGEDQRLLMGLARPHLTGIIAYAISRVIHRQETESEEQQDLPATAQTLDMPPDAFGKEILSALSSHDTPVFGYESSAPPAHRKKASQSHIDALKAIARRSGKK
jgi:hypothetical protein